MYCHECGTEAEEYQSYCTTCGAKLRRESTDRPENSGDSAGTADEDVPTSDEDAETEVQTNDEGTGTGDADTSTSETDPEPHASPTPDDDTAESEPRDSAGEPPTEGSAGEMATSAFFGYAGIVLLRASGVSALVFAPYGTSLAAGPLHAAGVFVFYDGFLFALVSLAASGYLTARRFLGWGDRAGTLATVDRVASVALSLSSLLYALGIGAAVLG